MKESINNKKKLKMFKSFVKQNTMKIGFDIQKYIRLQKKAIINEIKKYGKVYFELGGKLLDDYHASRVLPGFSPDTKMRILSDLKDYSELVFCINSENIQNERIRSDYNTLYVEDCLKLIESYRNMGFLVSGIVLSLFNGQEKAIKFSEFLKSKGENVYFSKYASNYPNDIESAIGAFKDSDYIQTSRPLVIITSSGSASGKLSTCLAQIYQEYLRGNKVGYSKYDIFPVWNLPVNHPLNLAFLAATADSKDEILVDTYYQKKHNKIVSNYNRDLNAFPLISKILALANNGETLYSSPTEMVVNKMKEAIIDDELVCEMSKKEIYRRLLTYYKQYLRGQSDKSPIIRVKNIMRQNGISMDSLNNVKIARSIFKKNPNEKIGVLQLLNGKILIAKDSSKYSIGSKLIWDYLSLIGIKLDFINDNNCKIDIWNMIDLIKSNKLNLNLFNNLINSDLHTSYVIPISEEMGMKQFGINVTCELKTDKLIMEKQDETGIIK